MSASDLKVRPRSRAVEAVPDTDTHQRPPTPRPPSKPKGERRTADELVKMTTYLPPNLDAQLRLCAGALGKSKTMIIREALTTYFADLDEHDRAKVRAVLDLASSMG